ncbi:MAG: hypothetical protein EA426_08310 [Spirochaetaceae bacterium]|nr:MAG: hypothetical protein EA426_08310 [Spirochaetaceae bacterium]
MSDTGRNPDNPTPTREELSARLERAVEIAESCGKTASRYFGTALDVELKDDASPVTVADRETEEAVKKALHATFPGEPVTGEESGSETAGGSRWRWIVDPIDGTRAFVAGVPLYTVLIAAMYDGSPIIGVIHSPETGETVAAADGQGCYLDGVRTAIRDCTRLAEAVINVTDFADFARRCPTLSRNLIPAVSAARGWGDGYGYLLLAAGRTDAMLDPIMNPWDVAPLIPIVEQAGGVITALDGRSTGPLPKSAVAAGEVLHGAILALS